MDFFTQMDKEHRLIEKTVGSMVTLAEQSQSNQGEFQSQLQTYSDFLKRYIDAYHHGKEEDLLIPTLTAMELGFTGPVQVIVKEHRDNKEIIEGLLQLTQLKNTAKKDRDRFKHLAEQYAVNIWEHIDKEDSVLFKEAETRIKGKDRIELNQKNEKFEQEFHAEHPDFADLLQKIQELSQTYPPTEDLSHAMRGEGCYICRHFGTLCQGIEEEWWTEEDWQTFHERSM